MCCNTKISRAEQLFDDGKSYCCTRIGNSYLIYGKKSSHFPYHIMVGPEWYCMLVTYLLIIVPTFFFIYNIARQWGSFLIVLSTLTGFSTLLCFTLTACTDPGIVFEHSKLNEDVEAATDELHTKIECGQCAIKRPPNASHCHECGVCIEDIDHHCPWTGKCIGKKNLYPFLCFLWALSIHVILVVVIVILALAEKKNILSADHH